jgi:hypothetical protein
VRSAILERDEAQLLEIHTICAALSGRGPAVRAELQESERRLAVVAQMRALYADLRRAKERLTAARV